MPESPTDKKTSEINGVSKCNRSLVHNNKTSGNALKIHNITLMHQNVQCLRNKTLEIEVMLNYDLQAVDIFCCTEHWLNAKEINLYNIQNFKLTSSFCRSAYKNGGSAIFVKQHLLCTEKTQTSYLNIEKTFEHAVTEISTSNCTIIVACIYRSPNGCMKTFLEHMELLLNHLKSKKKPLVICGDFNINFLSNDIATSEFRSLIHSYNLFETIDTPTRVTSTSQTCLDQIIIDCDTHTYTVENLNMGVSDHNALFLHLQVGLPESQIKQQNTFTYKRSFSEENIEYFKYMLGQENWIDIFDETDFDTKSVKFIDTITHYLNIAFPLKKVKISHNMHFKHKNWITKGIITSCKRKAQLQRLCQVTNDLNLKTYFKKYKKILKKVIYEAKSKYNRDYIINAGNKGKAIWEIVKRETGKKSNAQDNEIKITINGKIIENTIEIAEIFNKYFQNATQNLGNQQMCDLESTILDAENQNTIFLTPVTSDEILKIINNLKNSFSRGLDEIPDIIVKKCSHLLVTPLLDICNSSITAGKFPENLKIAKVYPVFKKGIKEHIENYRPISLLSVFSKILEKVMYNRLISFLEYNNVLTNSQFGFRKGKGINHAILSFTESIFNAKDNRDQTLGLFLDLSKAFDTVNHKILIYKLQRLGIRGLAGNWFYSYLNGRKQFVEINSVKSNLVDIKHGVPQGSILGPILFLLYINDLPLNLPQARTVLFADDTNIIFNDSNKSNLETKIIDTSARLEQWLTANNLNLNVNKTVCIHFTQQQLHDPIQILLNNNIIKEVQNTKFLGVWIDSNFTWECHIQHLTEKLSRLCYAFRVLTKVTPMAVLKSVYFAYIHSILSYGIIIWGTSPKAVQILKLQKRIIKIIKQVPIRSNSREIFKELEILPLPCIYILETVCFIHQNMELFKTNSDYHNYNTRHSTNIHMNYHRLTRSLHSLSHTGVNLYNKLPNAIKSFNNKRFKKSVINILLRHMPYTVNEYLNNNFTFELKN